MSAEDRGAGADVAICCREFTLGREDWNRGVRSLERAYLANGRAHYRPDGTLLITGFPLGDLLLEPADISRALAEGLELHGPDFEAEISAETLRQALLPVVDVTPQFIASR